MTNEPGGLGCVTEDDVSHKWQVELGKLARQFP